MYGKVFDSIYDGTLYGHWEAIVTMQQLIVLATPDGVVDMTPNAIAARTSIPLDIIRKGLTVLESPDPYTRTPGEDGRRIVPLDEHRPWGWRLVNHGKYQRLRNMAEKRAADRTRIAEKRKKTKDVAIASQCVANVAHSDSYSDSYSNKEKDSARKKRAVCIPTDFSVSERVKNWADGKGYQRLDAHLEHFVGWAKASGKSYADWDQAFMNAIRDDWAKVRANGSVPDYSSVIAGLKD